MSLGTSITGHLSNSSLRAAGSYHGVKPTHKVGPVVGGGLLTEVEPRVDSQGRGDRVQLVGQRRQICGVERKGNKLKQQHKQPENRDFCSFSEGACKRNTTHGRRRDPPAVSQREKEF